MGLKTTCINRRVGNSSDYLLIPHPMKRGEKSTIAASRLILADPRGEIDENELLKFMEEEVEPSFWKWMREREKTEDE